MFNVWDLACLKPVCRVPRRAGWCEASCHAKVQWQLQAEFIYACTEALWGGKISGTGGRTKSTVIFRMLLLALLCDNNTTSLVQCNFAGAFQFGI